MYLFLAVLDPCCCARTSSSCGEWGLLSSCDLQASHCGGLARCGAQASVVAAHGLSNCGSWALSTGSGVVVHSLSCSMDCGIFQNPHQTRVSALPGRFFFFFFFTSEPPGKPLEPQFLNGAFSLSLLPFCVCVCVCVCWPHHTTSRIEVLQKEKKDSAKS